MLMLPAGGGKGFRKDVMKQGIVAELMDDKAEELLGVGIYLVDYGNPFFRVIDVVPDGLTLSDGRGLEERAGHKKPFAFDRVVLNKVKGGEMDLMGELQTLRARNSRDYYALNKIK